MFAKVMVVSEHSSKVSDEEDEVAWATEFPVEAVVLSVIRICVASCRTEMAIAKAIAMITDAAKAILIFPPVKVPSMNAKVHEKLSHLFSSMCH